MRRTTMALLAVLLLGGTAYAADDGCYGEITVGHGWGNVRKPGHNDPSCFFTYKWGRSASRNDIPVRDAMRIEEACTPAMGGKDKGMYCQTVGKFRKAKDGVPQLVKLKGVKVIDAKSVKSGRGL
jgi:hypothetical protein